MMMRSLPYRLALATALILAVAPEADAQSLIERIKKEAEKRAAAAKAKRDSMLVETAGKAVDSTMSKANRPITSGAELAANKYDGALNASERALKSQFGPSMTKEQIVAMLEKGRAVIPHIQFVPGTDQLEATAEKSLQALADAMSSMEGIFLVEIYADSAKDAGAAAVAGPREVALKTRLVAAQMKGERFFVRASGIGSPGRVEVMKAQ